MTFKPTATGARNASLSVTDNASGSPQSIPLTGTGVAPAVSLSGSTLTFAGQLITTTSAAQSVTLTNSGTAPLTISSITVTGTNGGALWIDISGTGATALPNTPANDVVIDPDVPNTLYLATDIGVFTTSNDNAGSGTVWSPLGNGLPTSVVTSLRPRRPSRTLRAGTHGRSMWLIHLTNLAPPPGPLVTSISPALASATSR